MAMCVIALPGSGSVPVLLVRRKPNNIARPDFLDWSTLTLSPANTGRNNQSLTEGMCMPGSARTGLERDPRATNTCRLRSFK